MRSEQLKFFEEASADPPNAEERLRISTDMERVRQLMASLRGGRRKKPVRPEVQAAIDAANTERGNLVGYDCPICRNRGYFADLDEDGGRVDVPCPCMKIRRGLAMTDRRLKMSGLGNLPVRCTFEGWTTAEPWQAEVLETARDYAERPDGWMIMTGGPGAGKTHLCTAVTVSLIRSGRLGYYMPWRQDATRLSGMLSGRVDGDYGREMDVLRSVPLLYIDDLFKVRRGDSPTSGEVRLAFDIINSRYNDGTTLTIISTEHPIDALLAIDEATGSRIAEMSTEHQMEITGARNYRLRNLR